jgi:hypothetical protein
MINPDTTAEGIAEDAGRIGAESAVVAGEEAPAAAVTAAEDSRPLAGRDARGRFTGAGGYGAEAESQGLSAYELATGRTVVRDQVRATLSEGSGAPRYYDGLVHNPDGTYTGIEVKSGSATRTPGQRVFDEAVDNGAIARATLNGQPIQITSTVLVRVN